MWSDRLLIWLFRRFPPRPEAVIFKESPGRSAEEYELEADRPYHNWFGMSAYELFGDRAVLDLGSGFGGSTVRYLEYGARSVVGLEVDDDRVQHGTRFAIERGVAERVSFVRGLGEQIPCSDETLDLVVMYDVLEHVISPQGVLAASYRV